MFIYHVNNYINEYKEELFNYVKILSYKLYSYELVESIINEDDMHIIIHFAYKILDKYVNVDNKTFFNKYETEQYLKKYIVVCLWISQKFHKEELRCYSTHFEYITGFNYKNIINTEKKILKYIDYKILNLYNCHDD
jgi:hypothetical protein